ncbi:MAG TPA: nuclear transport factor 2 family protein [Mycobacteriales bacterium]|nr:nuclear transport factor 2 family protein [Mycobacteriales bacterium]
MDAVIARWHAFLDGDGDGELGDLLADDVVFFSPVVYTPQRGKDITMMYLQAAAQVLVGSETDGRFRYTKQVLAGNQAVLEFETTLADKYVNGVDIITCDESGRIVEFRVMLRPLQAVNAVHEQMRAMLESMG